MNEQTGSELYILAVEDDPIYAESLELLLQEIGYRRYAIADNAIDALKFFREQVPDLLLMDININGSIDGISFAELASGIRKVPIIYVTAFSDTATFDKAKQTAPAAYLTKPYNEKDLARAIELAVLQSNRAVNPQEPSPAYKAALAGNAFFVKYNNRLLKVPVADLLFIEVEEKYCYLHTADNRYVINIRLKNLLEQLPAEQFLQTHRSFAVRLDAVEEINLEYEVLKIGGKEIPIGKAYKARLLATFKTF